MIKKQPLVIALTGIIVMIGWALNVPILKSLHNDWVTMKFSTAVCFVLIGIALSLKVSYISASLGFIASFVMGNSLHSLKTNETFFLDVIFQDMGTYSVSQGVPSIGTMVLFFIIGVAIAVRGRMSKLSGLLSILVSSMAMLGYLIETPLFYLYVPGVSTGMALHTAFLFLMIGIILIDDHEKPLDL